MIVAEGAFHPVAPDGEDLGDRPDLFDGRQVGGNRRPPVQESGVLFLEPSFGRSRCVTTSAVLLENLLGTVPFHERRNVMSMKHLDVCQPVQRF